MADYAILLYFTYPLFRCPVRSGSLCSESTRSGCRVWGGSRRVLCYRGVNRMDTLHPCWPRARHHPCRSTHWSLLHFRNWRIWKVNDIHVHYQGTTLRAIRDTKKYCRKFNFFGPCKSQRLRLGRPGFSIPKAWKGCGNPIFRVGFPKGNPIFFCNFAHILNVLNLQ